MIRALVWSVLLPFSIGLVACANLQTISRRTTLPVTKEGGKAIHLDAQQRLVLVKAIGQYCAEPSPDALAAYAASLSLSASVPRQGAGALAQALQSAVGSIGLRTQSITLMRDALYRMCEAYVNGALGPTQVAILLGRSQDLTAVILAIEQLTGAVVANQVALAGTAGAGAAASLLSIQQLLDAARKDEETKTQRLEEAKEVRDATQQAVDEKRKEAEQAKRVYEEATAPGMAVSEAERTRLKADWERQRRELVQLQDALAAAEARVQMQEKLLAESRRIREIIENQREAALTTVVANTTGTGQLSLPGQRRELSEEATVSIAKAVQGMVEKVLAKEYTQDSCMALLTYIPADFERWTTDQKASFARVRDLCMQLVSKSLFEAIAKTEVTFGVDETTRQIEKALAEDATLRRRLRDWLRRNGLNISVTTLLYGNEYTSLRERAIRELAVP